jgi:cell division protein FtsI/penicillin-binding protein 2
MGEDPQKKKKKKNQVPFRLNILFIIVFLLFSTLILRLGVVQIVQGEDYKAEANETQKVTSKQEAARGKMYGTNGELLVDNKSKYAITYTRPKGTDNEELLKLARKLTKYIHLDTDKVTKRDEEDYWILTHPNIYDEKLSPAEKQKYKDDKDNKAYQVVLERITDKDLKQLDKQDMQVIAIWRELTQSMDLTPHYVKKGLDDKTVARIGEHLDSLPGINLTVAPTRVYPHGHEFYLGSVGSIQEGELDRYLVRGYNRNDQVGTSNLEQYYEDVLNGTATKTEYTVGANGKVTGDPKRIEGHRGNDIELTINIKLQKKVNKILEDEARKATLYPGNHVNKVHGGGAYAVVVNPNTGGILAMGGKKYENGKIKDVASQTVHGAYAVGSTVKGATLLAGLENDIAPTGFVDKPITFKDNTSLKSWNKAGLGYVTRETALERSSNIYMAMIAAKMAGFQFQNGRTWHATYVPSPNSQKMIHAFEKLRNVYSQFGLGAKTGIDLPSEGDGYKGPIPPPYSPEIMRFAFGQYDTYTPISVAQYMSTIANGGNRMQLHFLKSIREPSKDGKPGKVVYKYEPHVLNHITMSDSELDIVHRGFYLVTHGSEGTARELGSLPYDIAGKTGTADVDLNHDGQLDSRDTVNELFTGYAPYNDPEVVVSVLVTGDDNGKHYIETAKKVFEAYFDLKKKD